jgi:hypothetical protein
MKSTEFSSLEPARWLLGSRLRLEPLCLYPSSKFLVAIVEHPLVAINTLVVARCSLLS